MVDRAARNLLKLSMDQYRHEEIDSGEFDLINFELAKKTEDETVKFLVHDLWGMYDDLKDHKVIACKRDWQYLERVMLLLDTDLELKPNRTSRRWTLKSTYSLVLLTAGIVGAFSQPWVEWYVALPILCSIGYLFTPEAIEEKEPDRHTYPFPNVTLLAEARRQHLNFERLPYPEEVEVRTKKPLRPWFIGFLMNLIWSPLYLLSQALPDFKGPRLNAFRDGERVQ